MTNETLTQKVLFDTNEQSVNHQNTSKPKGLSNYVKIPVITLGILGSCWLSALGVCKYQENKVMNEMYQKQAEQITQRQERILRIAQYKEDEPSMIEKFLTTAFNGDTYMAENLNPNEKKCIEQYRKDHPEYKPVKK